MQLLSQSLAEIARNPPYAHNRFVTEKKNNIFLQGG
jgi:hypothetical protein